MTFAQYNRLNIHVLSSNLSVLRLASKMIHKHHRFSRDKKMVRHKFYRRALKHHRDAQHLFEYIQAI